MYTEPIQRKKGIRYKYVEYFKNPITGERIKLSVTLGRNSKQAEKIAREMLQEKFNQKFITASQQKAEKLQNLTFYDVVGEWLEHIKPTLKVSTFEMRKRQLSCLKKYVDSTLCFVNFTPTMLEKMIQDLYYTHQRVFLYCNSILCHIKAIMRFAQKSGYIDSITDFLNIKIKKRPITAEELQKKHNKFLNKDELKEVLNQLNNINPRIALAMEFIALTGLRCGELLALRVQDYDENKSCISVNGSMRVNTQDRTTPKNIYSYRTVTLNERAKQILNKVILQNKQAAQWNANTYKDKGYIFTTKNGSPFRLTNIDVYLKRVKIENKNLSTHIFRHTHISMLAELNIPLRAVMQRVGHNNPNTTLKIYTHVTENMTKDMQEKLKVLNF